MSAPLSAICKSVLSADTIVLRGKVVGAGQLPKERVIHLEGLSAPRMGNRDRPDEPFAFEAREFLRSLVVGKELKFGIANTIATSSPPLEFGLALVNSPEGPIDVALAVVKAGWAKIREGGSKIGNEEEETRKASLKIAEEEAKNEGRGLWKEGQNDEKEVTYGMPEDPSAFLASWKGKPIDAIIEATPSGSSVRARLLLSPKEHLIVNVGIAGIRAPRSGSIGGEGGEEFGDEARFFVESRLLQRLIKITLLSLPTPTISPTSFNSTSTSAPTPPTMFLGTIQHPAGNIAALVLAQGLAKIIDWHAGFLSQSPTPGMMAELRKAEAEGKGTRRGVWRNLPLPSAAVGNGKEGERVVAEKDKKFEAVVVRVWSPDQLSVIKKGEKVERRIQLASVRAPRATDEKLGGYNLEGKELLRKKLIGKSVIVTIDYIKPAEGQFESRECVTVRTPSGTNIAEQLVERGLLYIIRHRQGDESRSADYDKLMAAEAGAVAATKGLHSGKDSALPRIVDASETAQKAAPWLSSLKRAGKTAGIVDFVAAGSRFKIYIPKNDIKLTLVLSQIRAPRTARNPNEKSEPFGAEAAAFVSRLVMQRDVEIQVETNDKSGGFIGKMFLNGQDVALLLVKEGLAKVDEYAAERGTKDLTDAQEEAKTAKKNLWASYDPATDPALANGANGHAAPATARKEYVDIVVSDVRGGGETPFSFAVQILQNGGIPDLENLMKELTVHHRDAEAAPASFAPRTNDVVSAKFTADDTWYRARVRRAHPAKKEAEVLYIDYGNSEIIPYSRLRPLTPQFKGLDGQAKEATLSFVTLLGSENDYGADALDRFRELCEGRQLIANIDARDSNLLHLSLFDPENPSSSTAHENSINVELVKEGLARIDARSRFRSAYPNVVKALDDALKEAKRTRAGAFEMGDIFED